MKIDVAAISDTGLVREANEDSLLVDKDLFVFAVADGMGGHVAGEIASATAIETIRAAVGSGIGIEKAILKAHNAVKEKAKSDEKLSGMGTTVTSIGFSSSHQLVIAHVGDSRAYVLHREMLDETTDNSTALVRLTKDHSLVEELVEAGQITQEEADVHPRRSVITRALGIEGDIEVDVIPLTLLKDDRYLICSDGLTSMIRDEEISHVISTQTSPNECAKELVSRANKAGGNDNITVIILDVIDPQVSAPIVGQVAQSIPTQTTEKQIVYTKGRIAFSLRIFIAIGLVVALVAGAYITTKNYAKQGYFLDVRSGQVVLMNGRIGGVLWWDPVVDTQTGIEMKDLNSADRLRVKRNETFTTRNQALKALEQIRKNKLTNSTNSIEPEQIPSSSSTVSLPTPTTASIGGQ